MLSTSPFISANCNSTIKLIINLEELYVILGFRKERVSRACYIYLDGLYVTLDRWPLSGIGKSSLALS